MFSRVARNLFVAIVAVLVFAGPFGLCWPKLSAAQQISQRTESIVLGMGCFWGAEKRMSALPGVVDVISGYAGGSYPDPTYRKIFSSEGRNDVVNYAEVVKVTFDPTVTSVEQILVGFWVNHDPTQGNRQGHDVGSNYRSAIFFSSEVQKQAALMTREAYQKALTAAGFGEITTEIAPLTSFYAAEEYHQDYLARHPNGYCGLGGTGVKFPTGTNDGSGAALAIEPLEAARLSRDEQLIVFEAEFCPFCKLFHEQVLNGWNASVPITSSLSPLPPKGWKLKKALWATPTIVLFRDGMEVARFTGYDGEQRRFRDWLGKSTLSEE